MPKPMLSLLSAFALLAPVASVRAALLVYMPLTTQTAVSDAVLRGRVLEASADWDRERRTIWTTLVIEVTESFKGTFTTAERVEVKILGGTASDGVRLVASGMPEVEAGGEYVFFLVRTPQGDLIPWGLKQSVMKVVRPAEGEDGEVEVERDLGGVAVVERFLDGEEPFRRKPLSEFSAKVRAAAALESSDRARQGGK
jgi:hypothetical protein